MTDRPPDKPTSPPVALRIALGACRLSAERLADLDVGVMLPLTAAADAMVDLYAGGSLAARGRAVNVGGKLGLRIDKPGPHGGAYVGG